MAKKRKWVTIVIIFAVLLLSVTVLNRSHPETEDDVAKCIGENGVLYIQFGCHACETQEAMFGDNYEYLTVVDCWVDREKCLGVRATPTWIINGKSYIGVKSVEELKKLTGC